MSNVIIGIADMSVCRDPDTITTLGLGSCVGIVLYDPTKRIGGMVHVMLPTISGVASTENVAKFADSGVLALMTRMTRSGAQHGQLIAKIAGGAHMFSKTTSSDIMKVGERNVASCLETLRKLHIPLRGDDTGGTYGRTIELNTANGMLRVKTVGHGEKFI